MIKFLFKYSDFAKSAWSLAGGMLLVTALTAWRSKGDLGMTGIALGMPMGVLLFWLFYTTKLQLARRRPLQPSTLTQPSPPPSALSLEAEVQDASPSFGRLPRPFGDPHLSRVSLQTHEYRNRQLLGREPHLASETKKLRDLDQWHR